MMQFKVIGTDKKNPVEPGLEHLTVTQRHIPGVDVQPTEL